MRAPEFDEKEQEEEEEEMQGKEDPGTSLQLSVRGLTGPAVEASSMPIVGAHEGEEVRVERI